MKRTATQLCWQVLLKCASSTTPDFLKERVRAVAKMRKFPTPSDRDVAKIFPPNWEDAFRKAGKEPAWQVQLENSDWLKAQNSAQIGGGPSSPFSWGGNSSRGTQSSGGFWSRFTPEEKFQLGIMAATVVGTAAFAYMRYRENKAEEEAREKKKKQKKAA